MILEVPYYSQRLDVADPAWRSKACGICALKMAMDFLLSRRTVKLDDLIKEGAALPNAYDPRFGWVHDGLVALARAYGLKGSFRKEWAEKEKENALGEISDILKKGLPVLASVKSASGGHLVLLVGFDGERDRIKAFYAHDPDAENREDGENKLLPFPEFLNIWKGRIIVASK